MSVSTENIFSSDLSNSNARLTETARGTTWTGKLKKCLKEIKYLFLETTVEPCLFIYMMCTALSSFAVQNMHLEKSCRVNFDFGDEVCDRISNRNTTGLEDELYKIQSLVAKVVAWKFPLQTAIPAVMVLFVGAWSDKNKKRKICILFPMIGEIVANVGLLLATYFFHEISLGSTALIEALPAALTGSYIIIFMGMYSFMADRTSVENRTFRIGIVSICVSLGTPTGTAISGILLRKLGYYGIFTLILLLHTFSFLYGLIRLEDVRRNEEPISSNSYVENNCMKKVYNVSRLVINTIVVALKPRPFGGRTQILLILVLYLLMVGPLYGDSQVAYLYSIRKFNFTEVEYSIYGTFNILIGLLGTMFCIFVLSKKLHVQDSIIGFIAGMSRVAASFMFAFAPNRKWYYSAPVLNIFSHTGLTAVRSIATKSVPVDEIAKLSSLMGVMEAIAPSVYMPSSSFIYVSTIETFPGAFYMFDAALTTLAMAFFLSVHRLIQERNNAAPDLNKKEDFSRTNEVSHF